MTTYTITEALAELKTIAKRLEKKRAYIMPYLWRQEGLKDPLEKEPLGSAGVVARERQSIKDLEERVVNIRTAIQSQNLSTPLTVGDQTRYVMGWLNWRKEVAKGQVQFVMAIRQDLQKIRATAQQKGYSVNPVGSNQEPKLQDIVVNVDEAALAKEAEMQETILGELDGKLQLLNATTTVSIPD